MRLSHLFFHSLKNSEDILQVKNKSFWKVFVYILFLSVLLTLPTLKQSLDILNTFQADGQKIIKKLPDFSIKDQRLVTTEKNSGFIYQTNHLIFTFDPEGKRNTNDVQNDLVGNLFGIAFLKDRFVFAVPKNEWTQTLFKQDTIEISYKNQELQAINRPRLEKLFTSLNQNYMIYFFTFFISFYSVFISFLLNLVFLALIVNIYSRFRFIPYYFMDNFKIITICSTLPTLISVVLQIVKPGLNDDLVTTTLTLLLYYGVTKNTKRLV